MEQGRTCWIPCDVYRGMFPQEYGIVIGEKYSGFIAPNQVKVSGTPETGSPTPGQVMGRILDEDDQFFLVTLSWEPFESRCVKVPRSEVTYGTE